MKHKDAEIKTLNKTMQKQLWANKYTLMYSNFSALKTNMAIYLSPFQRHLTFSTSRLRSYKYMWLRIFFREKITRSPPYVSPVPTKLLLSTEHNVWSIGSVCFARSKKKKPGKVDVVPTFLHSFASKALSLALAAGRKITTVFLVPGLEELVRKRWKTAIKTKQNRRGLGETARYIFLLYFEEHIAKVCSIPRLLLQNQACGEHLSVQKVLFFVKEHGFYVAG